MSIKTFICACAFLLVIAGCGGGGGGGGSSANPNSLGSRGVPGGTISAAKPGPLTAGAPATFHITLSGGLTATEVRAWIAVDYVGGVTGTLATANPDGSYDVTITVPSPFLADSNLFVRVTDGGGSVIETGNDDFKLN